MIKKINNIKNIEKNNFLLIAGPCVIEDEQTPFQIAEEITKISNRLNIPFIFKASYKKANRSRLDSFTGIGDIKALEIIKSIGERFNIPTITDIHLPVDAEIVSRYVDVLQIPAFLCRQTELLVAAAKTGKHVNIKKGQFLSPKSMIHALNKIKENGNNNVMITERGTMFGYQDIVVDYKSIPIMQKFNVPVILDITHSLQKPNQTNGITGGSPELIEKIAMAGVAIGADGIFIETHQNPMDAKSDGLNMLALNKLEALLKKLIRIKKAIN